MIVCLVSLFLSAMTQLHLTEALNQFFCYNYKATFTLLYQGFKYRIYFYSWIEML